MRNIIGSLVLIAGIILGIYVGGYIMFVDPIIEACKHFDAGTLTGMVVGATVLKCIFASVVGWIIFYVGVIISKAIIGK